MTKSRRHLPNEFVSLTRRTRDRQYLTRPDRHCRDVSLWEIAKSSSRNSFDVSAFMMMSNHPHIAGTDRTGDRSDFVRDFCAGVARARNCKLRRQGRLWDGRQFGDTIINPQSPSDIEEKLLYIWLNPVRAGLVRRAEQWPGAKILPRDWGKPMKVRKPHDKFYRKGAQEEDDVIEFVPMPPPGFEHLTLEEVIEYFEQRLREEEDKIARRRRYKFRGAQWVKRQNPFDSPRTKAPFRQLSPKFASKNPQWITQAITAHREFQKAYQTARKRWLDGDHEVEFPAGTIQLRKQAPICCSAVSSFEPTVRQAA